MEEGCLSTQLPKDENGKFEICCFTAKLLLYVLCSGFSPVF